MKRVSGKELARVLEKHGWVLTRTKGAHRRYEKEGYPPVTVPIHGTRILKPKTQQSIMRHAGLTEEDRLCISIQENGNLAKQGNYPSSQSCRVEDFRRKAEEDL